MPKRYSIILVFLFFALSVSGQNNNFWSASGNYVEYTQNLSGTGIHKVYIFRNLSGAEISYTTNASIVRFYTYTVSMNDREAVPAANISSTAGGGSTVYTIRNLQDGKACFAEIDGGLSPIIWIVDYNLHLPQLNSIQAIEGSDKCEYLQLVVDKSDELYFHATTGGKYPIARKYDITYDNLQWNEDEKRFADKATEINDVEIGSDWVIEAPLTDTRFKISGDGFAKHFGLDFHIFSDTYTAIKTEPHVYAEIQDPATGSMTPLKNEEYSAPAEIFFYGLANEPAAYFYVWNIYKTTDPENSIVRYTDRDIRFTFKEAGEYVVKLEVSDRDALCADTVITPIKITDFEIIAPKFIILDGNHRFKVKYKSVFNFKCTIFNRWGNKIYEFNDPSQGWDGTYNGRTVSTGVYYYIITAESGDGKKHTLNGPINALRPK